jgi:glycosyltransferase involved in cell wall biosynthesis
MKVLVVIPTHDRIQFLDEALQSLEKQTWMANQIVITGNVGPVRPIPGCTYINSDDNLIDRLNSAIENSDCDAFIILCDDDMLEPEYIEKTVTLMEATNADIVYTEFNNEPVTSLIRKSIWKRVGGFCPIGFFDWDFYLSCHENGAKSIPLREHLFTYRQHEEQMASHGAAKADGRWEQWNAAIRAKHPSWAQWEANVRATSPQ